MKSFGKEPRLKLFTLTISIYIYIYTFISLLCSDYFLYTQPLTNLKKMILTRSCRLKELPDLSNATNIEKLELSYCESLVEIPSSVSELQKLNNLTMNNCAKLEVVPTLINLASLDYLNMDGCSQLRSLPEISTHVSRIIIDDTLVEEVPASFMRFTRLQALIISGSRNFKTLTHVPECLEYLSLRWTGIEKIPDWIKDLRGLYSLDVAGCSKLKCLPQLPVSLWQLNASDCESLESVSCKFKPSLLLNLNFINCFKLNQQTRGEIIQQTSGERILPGREVPAEFSHQATGPLLTIRRDGDSLFPKSLRFKACIVISPSRLTEERTSIKLSCCLIGKNGGFPEKRTKYFRLPEKSPGLQSEHLCLFQEEIYIELGSEITFEFSCTPSKDYEIVKCGVGIYSDDIDESDEGKYIDEIVQCGDGIIYTNQIEQVQSDSDYLSEEEIDKRIRALKTEEVSEEVNKHGGCWSWLCKIALTGSSCLF